MLSAYLQDSLGRSCRTLSVNARRALGRAEDLRLGRHQADRPERRTSRRASGSSGIRRRTTGPRSTGPSGISTSRSRWTSSSASTASSGSPSIYNFDPVARSSRIVDAAMHRRRRGRHRPGRRQGPRRLQRRRRTRTSRASTCASSCSGSSARSCPNLARRRQVHLPQLRTDHRGLPLRRTTATTASATRARASWPRSSTSTTSRGFPAPGGQAHLPGRPVRRDEAVHRQLVAASRPTSTRRWTATTTAASPRTRSRAARPTRTSPRLRLLRLLHQRPAT